MANQIQIIGTLKCKDTQKTIRFLKERAVQVHFLDLNIKGLSLGELNNIKNSISLDNLLDKNSKEYKRLNLEYMVYDTVQILLENPFLIKTPIIRFGKKAVLGYDTAQLSKIIDEIK